MAKWTFETKLERPQGVGTWTFAPIPVDLLKETGIKARTRVKGTVEETPFRCSLLPRGSGQHFVVVNKEVRDAIGKTEGDRVRIVMELDTSPVYVKIPADLKRALDKKPRAKGHFEKMAPSHKKAYASWVAGAKQEETRKRRVARAVKMMAAGRTL